MSFLGGSLQETLLSLKGLFPKGTRRHREWYDQDKNEWVILLNGSAGIVFEGNAKAIELNLGDHLNIRAHQRHRVEWTDPDEETVWLALHY